MTELPAAPPPTNPLYDPRCNRDLPIPGAGCNRGMNTCRYPECTFPEAATATAEASPAATAAPPRAVLVDIDGTLALRGNRSPYDWDRVGEDQPNPPVIELVRIIAAAGRHRIIVMSGRDEICRRQTEMWLDAQQVPFDELHMRRRKDNRKDSVVKADLYRAHVEGRFEVAFVVDDRDQVVRQWRSMGLTVFQCADGDF